MYFKILILTYSLFILASCSNTKFGSLADPHDKKEIVIATQNSSVAYLKEDDDRVSGFEYELIEAFAKAQGWKTSYKVLDTTQEVVDFVRRGDAHIGAASLTITDQRNEELNFSNHYQVVNQQVVCGKPKKIKNKKQLKNLKLIIATGTSHQELLQKLQLTNTKLNFELQDDSVEALLEKIWEDRSFCTLIDSHILSVHRRYFPELRVVYTFKNKDKLAWALPKGQEETLKTVNEWLSGDGSTIVKRLRSKYYAHVKDFDYYDTKKFIERMKTRLPKYKAYFKEAASQSEIPWTLLAAISYQESQWNPKAVSYTGVRGLMMLTQVTAKEVKVKDRTDPKQSIMGGARYLRKLIERVPNYIPASQRRWMALAAYNVGYYHLRDALSLTIIKNKNPLKWFDVEHVLPLLSQRKYFKNLKYGYARGLEPVIYVSRIRSYHDLLLGNLE